MGIAEHGKRDGNVRGERERERERERGKGILTMREGLLSPIERAKPLFSSSFFPRPFAIPEKNRFKINATGGIHPILFPSLLQFQDLALS